MAADDKMLIIRRNDFFSKLSDEEYNSLNIIHNFITADKNSYIYFDPQGLNKLYFIKEGYVRIGHINDEGNEIVKDILHPGDVFGQFTLEKENLHGEYALAYKTDVSLCAFSIQDFETLLHSKPGLGVEYSKKIGGQLRRINNRLINLLQKDARTRLLFFFWTLVLHHELSGNETATLDNYFTHEDIARLTGTSRQTVTSLISKLYDEGIVEVGRKQILIPNIRLLQKEVKVG